MLKELKAIILNNKSVVALSAFFAFLFALGFLAGATIPNMKYDAVYDYAVLLEKENHKLNKRVKSCNRE